LSPNEKNRTEILVLSQKTTEPKYGTEKGDKIRIK
jgi:hypothetical protein